MSHPRDATFGEEGPYFRVAAFYAWRKSLLLGSAAQRLRIYDPALKRSPYCGCTRVNIELFEYALEMKLDRILGQVEQLSDHLVGGATAQLSKYRDLTVAEFSLSGCRRSMKGSQQAGG